MKVSDQDFERSKAREQLREAFERSGLSQQAFSESKGIPLRTFKRWLADGPPDPVLDWIRIVSPD